MDEYEQYELGHRKRLAMKPGLTGMWQVSGRSDITDFDEVVALDAKYIEQWNITMDIKILWKAFVSIIVLMYMLESTALHLYSDGTKVFDE